NGNQGGGGSPIHEHFEQVDHPGGNPNNVEITTQDIVNDNRNGVHSTVVQHVAISDSTINGQSNVKTVNGNNGSNDGNNGNGNNGGNGSNGAANNGQGNSGAVPDGSAQEQRSNGSTVVSH
ncbi:hypothetical protein H4R19_003572, partial [Coemansia spiralis]